MLNLSIILTAFHTKHHPGSILTILWADHLYKANVTWSDNSVPSPRSFSISNFFQILPTKQNLWSEGRAHLCSTTSTQSNCHKTREHLSALSSRCLLWHIHDDPISHERGRHSELEPLPCTEQRISPCSQSSPWDCSANSTNTTPPRHRQQNVDFRVGELQRRKETFPHSKPG